MTAILAVNGDKLPCGCPASELTVDENSLRDLPACPLGDPAKHITWICKHHPFSNIVRQNKLKDLSQ